MAQTPLTLTVTITPAAKGQSKLVIAGQSGAVFAWLAANNPNCKLALNGQFSCAPSGAGIPGPQGPQGIQGVAGPAGPVGAAVSGSSLPSVTETPAQIVMTKPLVVNTPTLPVGFTAQPTPAQLAACDALVPAPGFVFQCVSTKGCMRRSILNSAVVCQ